MRRGQSCEAWGVSVPSRRAGKERSSATGVSSLCFNDRRRSSTVELCCGRQSVATCCQRSADWIILGALSGHSRDLTFCLKCDVVVGGM